MKILHVISNLNPEHGGVCQGLRLIVAGLNKAGVQNEIVSLDAPDAPYLAADSFETHALGPGSRFWQYGKQLRPWLLANLPRFDAVIVHGLWLYHGYAVQQVMRQLRQQTRNRPGGVGLPQVYNFPQGMLDPYFQRAAGRRLKAVRNTLYWAFIESRVVNEAAGVLFTAEMERQLARQPFSPYRPRREVVMGMGVDPPPVRTAAMRDAFLAHCPGLGEQPYLLFLSRIHEKKGVDMLIDAYASVLSAQPTLASHGDAADPMDGDADGPFPRLVIAGPGLDTPYGRQMQQLVAERPLLRDAVFFPGMLAGDAKWGALYGCDAFVLPTHQENFGIAITEALACDRPVLISNQTNIFYEIEQAGGGLVASDTPAGTRQLLERWLNLPPAEQRAMSRRARQTYLRYFSIDRVAERIIDTVRTGQSSTD